MPNHPCRTTERLASLISYKVTFAISDSPTANVTKMLLKCKGRSKYFYLFFAASIRSLYLAGTVMYIGFTYIL